MTKKESKHPDRFEMIQAIECGEASFSKHLDECPQCRQLMVLLRQTHQKDADLTAKPSPKTLYASRAIALMDSSRHPAQTVDGRIAFDSWTGLSSQQIREAPPGSERRLTLKAGKFRLEIVADKSPVGWDITARVYDQGRPTTKFALKVGNRKLYPEAHKCFYWSAKNPPRRVLLLSSSLKLDFGKLSW
jgi:hypothetical protein